MKRFRNQTIALLLLFFFTLPMAGCGTNPTPIPTPTPSTLQNIQDLFAAVGVAVAAFVPLAGSDGTQAVAIIKLICAVNPADPNAVANIQALLQQLWTQLSASQASAEAAAVVIALNLAWDYLNSQVANASAASVVSYLTAAITGLCQGINITPGTKHWLGHKK